MLVAAPLSLTVNSSTASDTTYPAYNAGTTYALGANVSATASDGWVHEYESLQADNTGNALTDAVWWLDLGPQNSHRMFDSKTGTVTTGASPLVVSVSPGQYFDLIALARIDGAVSARIQVDYSGQSLYDETISLAQDVSNWWDYYFTSTAEIRSALVVRPEIFYGASDITVTLTGSPAADVSCGLMMVSAATELGDTLQGPSVSIEDYSTKETDVFGNTYLLERDYADRASAQIVLDATQVDSVKRALAAYRATPALYNLNNSDTDYESLVIFGKYDSFSVDMQYYNRAFCSLDVVSIL